MSDERRTTNDEARFAAAVAELRAVLSRWDMRMAGQRAVVDEVRVLLAWLAPLAGDELEVVGEVVMRLRQGRLRYGQLEIREDVRDWAREAREEALDLVIYRVIAALANAPLGEEAVRRE